MPGEAQRRCIGIPINSDLTQGEEMMYIFEPSDGIYEIEIDSFLILVKLKIYQCDGVQTFYTNSVPHINNNGHVIHEYNSMRGITIQSFNV